jgi:hypothetical protein
MQLVPDMRRWIPALALLASACMEVGSDEAELEEAYGEILQNCVDEWPERPDVGQVLSGLASRSVHEVERQMWLSLLDGQLSRSFMERYLDCSGATYVLSPQEVLSISMRMDLGSLAIDGRNAREVLAPMLRSEADCQAWNARPEWERQVAGRIPATSGGATLGHFFIDLAGRIDCDAEHNLVLSGTMAFSDRWDFNAASHRDESDEMRVQFARNFLTGVPFDIVFPTTAFSYKQYWTSDGMGGLGLPVEEMTIAGIADAYDDSSYSDGGSSVARIFQVLYESVEEARTICSLDFYRPTNPILRALFDAICWWRG